MALFSLDSLFDDAGNLFLDLDRFLDDDGLLDDLFDLFLDDDSLSNDLWCLGAGAQDDAGRDEATGSQ